MQGNSKVILQSHIANSVGGCRPSRPPVDEMRGALTVGYLINTTAWVAIKIYECQLEGWKRYFTRPRSVIVSEFDVIGSDVGKLVLDVSNKPLWDSTDEIRFVYNESDIPSGFTVETEEGVVVKGEGQDPEEVMGTAGDPYLDEEARIAAEFDAFLDGKVSPWEPYF